MRIRVKGGDSMRSDVSSRRRRRREGELVVEDCWVGEEEVDGIEGVGAAGFEGGEGEALMPDSRRTVSSWSGGGRRY